MSQLLTGAIAIIKVNDVAIGFMKDVRITENIRRQEVKGLGTILTKEAPVVEWSGQISCSFYEIDYEKSGIAKAIRRDVGVSNINSQVGNNINNSNFEDNLVLDVEGVKLDIYKKITDVGSPNPNTGLIIPNKKPYAVITRCMITSDNVTIGDGSVSGRDQSFIYLDPIVY